jgi:hypothetical protein
MRAMRTAALMLAMAASTAIVNAQYAQDENNPPGVRGKHWNAVWVTVIEDGPVDVRGTSSVTGLSRDYATQLFFWAAGRPMGYDYDKMTGSYSVTFRAVEPGHYRVVLVCGNVNAVAETCNLVATNSNPRPGDGTRNQPVKTTVRDPNPATPQPPAPTPPSTPQTSSGNYTSCNNVGLQGCGQYCHSAATSQADFPACAQGCRRTWCR